jgi:starch phosphorylase
MLDGWWAEAYDGKNGFSIGNGSPHVSYEINDNATRRLVPRAGRSR